MPGSGFIPGFGSVSRGGNDFGQGAGFGGSATPRPGGPAGAAPGFATVGERAAGGRAGMGTSRSAAGLGGMPIGGGSGEREEDGEHRRPAYLVEPDVESLFGTDELTAPAVIGAG